jgi:hypothetical protein
MDCALMSCVKHGIGPDPFERGPTGGGAGGGAQIYCKVGSVELSTWRQLLLLQPALGSVC